MRRALHVEELETLCAHLGIGLVEVTAGAETTVGPRAASLLDLPHHGQLPATALTLALARRAGLPPRQVESMLQSSEGGTLTWTSSRRRRVRAVQRHVHERRFVVLDDLTDRSTRAEQLLALEDVVTRLRAELDHELHRSATVHDLRNLFTILAMELEMREGTAGLLAVIERAAELVEGLRDPSTDHESIDLAELLRTEATYLAGLAGAMDVRTRCEVEEGWIACDRLEARSLVSNLLINARRAGARSVAIRLGEHTGPGPRAIDGTTVPTGRWLALRVVDDGPGLAPLRLSAAFRSRMQGSGPGFGLPWVRHVVEGAGGYVVARGRRGRGLRIELFFPREVNQPFLTEVPSNE